MRLFRSMLLGIYWAAPHPTLTLNWSNLMNSIDEYANRIGVSLKRRGETIAVAESSSGGLISAALLAVPGASAFFMGGR